MNKKIVIYICALSLITILFGTFLYVVNKDKDIDSYSGNSLTVQEGEVVIVLTDAGYEPQQIKIKKGSTVTFTTTRKKPHWPASNLHPSHGIYPAFDPKRPLDPEESWSFTFERVGTWDFHDHIRAYFAGTIYVVEE